MTRNTTLKLGLLTACLIWLAPAWAQSSPKTDLDDRDRAPAAAPAAAPVPAAVPDAAAKAGEGHGQTPGARTAGRSGWAWPAAVLLLGSAVGVSTLGRRRALKTGALTGLLVVGGIAVLGFTRPREVAAGEPSAAAAAKESPFLEVDAATVKELGLRTEVVKPTDLAVAVGATGRVIAVEARQAHLGARVAGRLTSVRVRVGSRVQAGEVVATLDSVDAAQAAAALREATARVAAAERYLATRRELVASGAFTAAPLEEARRNLAAARVAQAQAASELAQARNELDAARAELTRTERLVATGSYTAAAAEEARIRLAESERALAEARSAQADSDAAVAEATSAVGLAQQRVASATTLRDRTARLAATGELDRAPLEQAQTTLAEARSRLSQVEAGLEQSKRQVQRGEELLRAELISLNDLEARRTAVREREAQRTEAAAAVANAQSALTRQERIAEERMTSGRAEQEAGNAVNEAQRELSAAQSRLAKAEARAQVVGKGIAPAQAAVEAATSNYQREKALAGDKTRANSALDSGRLRVAQAERIVAGKEGEVAESERAAQVATAALAREDRLAKAQVRGREQLLDAERELAAARIAADNAREVLALLGASGQARRGPVQLPVRAPRAGLVSTVNASVGEAVTPERDLVTIVDLSEVYVEADLPERDLARVREGQTVRVTVSVAPGEAFVGTVQAISGELDKETRAAHVRVLLPNAQWRLRPGMFAAVGFVVDRGNRVLTVPESAVQEVDGKRVVFVQRSPERYESRPLTLGRTAEGRIEVLDGLKVGETIVTEGSYLLKSQRQKSELGEGNGGLSE